jgi:ABC-type hemin transport system ATPase subunit
VVVLHDLTLASGFCDRVVLLVDGKALLDGDPPIDEPTGRA